jgi:hypothetical protein
MGGATVSANGEHIGSKVNGLAPSSTLAPGASFETPIDCPTLLSPHHGAAVCRSGQRDRVSLVRLQKQYAPSSYLHEESEMGEDVPS